MPTSIFRKELWTKPLAAWYLYDASNSFVYITTTLYFSQWIVVDRGMGELWFSAPFILATIILIFVSSYAGSWGDRTGGHYRLFLWTTLAAIASAACMIVAGRLPIGHGTATLFAPFFYGAYQFFYQVALVPYGVFMKHIAPSQSYGAVSGVGLGLNELGHIGGILFSLPIVGGAILLFGHDRLAPVIPSVFAFFLFALPALLVFRDRRFGFHQAQPAIPTPSFFGSLKDSIRDARRTPNVFPLLLGFYFFSDAIITVSLFSAIYLERVFGVSDTTKSYAALLVIFGFAAGSFTGGWLADRIGHRRILTFSLAGAAAAIIALAFAPTMAWNYAFFPFFGLFSGAAYASSRSYLASLISVEESGKFFGLYAFAERFASVIGPLVWSVIVWSTSGFAPWNYRFAALAMGLLVVIGTLQLLKTGNDVFKKSVGMLLIFIGIIALLTPFTPGSWLMFVGLEILGVRLAFWDKIKSWRKLAS